ncbi:GOLPH3/VPS74 family protein [Ornithinimicrobium murale]|uniref:GOLPH3/VPS74 family protein n=1 Tax=Ornithinimicrobium murale TaxID=1050153 RepID=UPI000E0D32ED|nr:GPP34 family phosphoprotein [Ornithinimicrobium murale]
MALLLAEELVLLCMDDETGQCELAPREASRGVALALVFELSLRGALTLQNDRLTQQQAGTDDPLLDLAAESARNLTPTAAVDALAAEDLLQATLVRLVSRGALHDADVFSPGVHLPKDPHPETAVRQRLREVLAQGRGADEQEAALVALLHHLEMATAVLPDEDAEVVRARAAEVSSRSGPMRDYQGEDGRPRVAPVHRSKNSDLRMTRSSWWDGLDVLDLVANGVRIFLP